jgi:aerobic carbon-monoxide dehydrogenase medium subunit
VTPARFAYARPATLDEALDLLARHGDEARILAGGQSLMPMMALRLARPAVLIDINRVAGLQAIECAQGEGVRIGAVARYAEIIALLARRDAQPLLRSALGQVAHPGIRNRGTLCGSLALADPAAEGPACALCLGAEIRLASRRGERSLPAADFFRGTYATALEPDELVREVAFPEAPPGWRFHFDEVARRRGDYALAGLAAAVRRDGGRVQEARLVFFALGSRPMRAEAAETLLIGTERPGQELMDAAAATLDRDLEVTGSLEHPASYKRVLARTLLDRALKQLLGP